MLLRKRKIFAYSSEPLMRYGKGIVTISDGKELLLHLKHGFNYLQLNKQNHSFDSLNNM